MSVCTPFPGCCGASIIHGFWGMSEGDIKKESEMVRGYLDTSKQPYNNYGLVFAMLNDSQKQFETMLIGYGFVKCATGKNIGYSKRVLHTYVKIQEEFKPVKLVEKKFGT